ncbi:PTS sugar transporter subunit IIA [Erysipelothrix larvae]|nr:PTS N-acetylgalactosamine transporter subunit IIA [Erysipelothrix larvae]
MIKLIICGHGNFASGLLSSLSLIIGNNSNIYCIDFGGEDDGSGIKNLFMKYAGNSQTIIATDLYGGTPFKQAAMLSMSLSNIHVLTGINLGMLLELSFRLNSTNSIYEILEEVVALGRDNISYFKP